MPKYITAALLASSLGLTATADPILEMMRAASVEGPIYAYDMSFDNGEIIAAGRVDPTQPEGSRITVTTPAEADWDDDFREGLAAIEKETKGDIWCSEFAQNIPNEAVILAQTPDFASYTFTPSPDADADKTEKKVFKKLLGTATLDKTDGAILSFKMSLPEPFKPMIVAKINTFEMDVQCTRAPDGRTYIEDFNMALEGSAMMQAFDQKMTRKITALYPIE
jgi:hypothetical protein